MTRPHYMVGLQLRHRSPCAHACMLSGARLPVVTMCYHVPGSYSMGRICSITRYCMTLGCLHGVRLPQLPGGYLWLPLFASVARYCITLRGVWLPQLPVVSLCYRYCYAVYMEYILLLPQLPGGYLWLPCVTSVTRYCMTLCCVRGVSVTWWLPVVTLCYQRYLVLQDPRLYMETVTTLIWF